MSPWWIGENVTETGRTQPGPSTSAMSSSPVEVPPESPESPVSPVSAVSSPLAEAEPVSSGSVLSGQITSPSDQLSSKSSSWPVPS